MLTAPLTELTAARATLLDACAEIAGPGVTGNRNNRFLELARGIAELVTNGALDRAEAAGNLRAAVDASRAMPYDPKLVRQALAAWFSAPVVQPEPAPPEGMVAPTNTHKVAPHWLRHQNGWRYEAQFYAKVLPPVSVPGHSTIATKDAPIGARVRFTCDVAPWFCKGDLVEVVGHEGPFIRARLAGTCGASIILDHRFSYKDDLPPIGAPTPPVSLPYHYMLSEIRRDLEDGYGYHQMRTTATLRQMRPIGTTLGPLDEVVITGGKEVGALFPNYDAGAKYEITIRRVMP
jgi:hypothetical protein